ncbi:hypothetical protein Tco_0703543 [Tanacetum coccineum]|uniref:Gag-Pol polyprotein n=1 Tax=Tanacetum coccineum TaxID=301880 RepID=A0ABQ4Y0I4_9ASTR
MLNTKNNNNMQTQTSSALHNAIMKGGGKDCPSMLAPGNYFQWKSRIKRYIHTKSNHELIHLCLKNPPYQYKFLTTYANATLVTLSNEGTSQQQQRGEVMETFASVPEDIQKWIIAEAEAVQIILMRIDNDIYSTVDACPNVMKMWKAIERLKQGESLESYYSRFYKMMNELVRNQCIVTNHQVNVQFLLQLKLEWQRFVTIVKKSQDLKNVSYHKLYDILKQHQNEVNKIRAERLAHTANPLALVAQQQPVYHHQPNPTPYTQSSSTISQATTRNKGKAIANSPPHTYDPEPEVVADDDASSKEEKIDKLMALILMSFKKIYKPTYNNLRTSSNTMNLNVDNTPRSSRGTYAADWDSMFQAADWDSMFQLQGIWACSKGIAEQVNWRDDTDDEPEDQELEAHYMYMEKIQEVTPDVVHNSGPIFDVE